MIRLGVVSFLNSRPLVAGLAERADVELALDVPSALPALLDADRVDAALIPIIDVIRSGGRYVVVSDACIACDGETMTVRVFSQTPPDRVRTLWVDGDSHTSVALARVMWRELYDRELDVQTIDTRQSAIDACEAVLLIGDKVVDPRRGSFAYEVDLGGAWRQHTGLPFVFAVWAAPAGLNAAVARTLYELLGAARDRGVAQADRIAAEDGPSLGWPVESARRYLTRCLSFTLDVRAVEGATLFARLCGKYGLGPTDAAIAWPGALQEEVVE